MLSSKSVPALLIAIFVTVVIQLLLFSVVHQPAAVACPPARYQFAYVPVLDESVLPDVPIRETALPPVPKRVVEWWYQPLAGLQTPEPMPDKAASIWLARPMKWQTDWVLQYESYILHLFMKVFAQQCRAGGLFVDSGANDGMWSLLASSYGCKVLAVEPQRLCVQYLSAAVRRNAAPIRLVQQALSRPPSFTVQVKTDECAGTTQYLRSGVSDDSGGVNNTGSRTRVAECTFVADTDFQPGDVGSGHAATAEACCSMCVASEQCAAAAWNGPHLQTCYLKSKYAKPKHSPGTSGCVPKYHAGPRRPRGRLRRGLCLCADACVRAVAYPFRRDASAPAASAQPPRAAPEPRTQVDYRQPRWPAPHRECRHSEPGRAGWCTGHRRDVAFGRRWPGSPNAWAATQRRNVYFLALRERGV